MNKEDTYSQDLVIAQRWCESKAPSWSVSRQLGPGGTARVFEINSPDGIRALKVYDAELSSGQKGEIEQKRIEKQLTLKGHDCPSLVQIYEGGKFEDRFVLMMGRAPGRELAKCLREIPRDRIRDIVDQIAKAALFLKGHDLCHRDIKAANVFISDDYKQATLLDISVIRDISDPVGAGSDREGQLPVLATARYSPPEYLFRLIDVGPHLWHALTVYQLGALLHDLIMGESLFEAEYLKSSENRYRFAWVVATTIPRVQSENVDQDLVFTARRALDKDWQRRSVLQLEDFLADKNTQQSHALALLGLSAQYGPLIQSDDLSARHQRITDVANALQEAIVKFLRKNMVTPKHEVKPGPNDASKLIVLCWNAPTAEAASEVRTIKFELALKLILRTGGYHFGASAKLSAWKTEVEREVGVEIPEIPDDEGAEAVLANQAESAFAKLAVEISQADSGPAGG